MNQRSASAPCLSIIAIGSQDVAEVLAHLAAVVGEDVAEAHHVAVRGLVEEQRPTAISV